MLAQIRHGSKLETPQVVDHHNGSLEVVYETKRAGTYDMSVTIDSVDLNIHGASTIQVFPAAVDPAATVITGLSSIPFRAGSLSRFRLHAADSHRNMIQAGGHEGFSVSISSESKSEVKVDVVPEADGAYAAVFTGTLASKHTVAVRLAGAELPQSPFDLDMLAARAHRRLIF